MRHILILLAALIILPIQAMAKTVTCPSISTIQTSPSWTIKENGLSFSTDPNPKFTPSQAYQISVVSYVEGQSIDCIYEDSSRNIDNTVQLSANLDDVTCQKPENSWKAGPMSGMWQCQIEGGVDVEKCSLTCN